MGQSYELIIARAKGSCSEYCPQLAIVQFIHGGQRLYTLLPARNRLPTSLAAAMQLPKGPRSISMTKSYDSNLMKRLKGL